MKARPSPDFKTIASPDFVILFHFSLFPINSSLSKMSGRFDWKLSLGKQILFTQLGQQTSRSRGACDLRQPIGEIFVTKSISTCTHRLIHGIHNRLRGEAEPSRREPTTYCSVQRVIKSPLNGEMETLLLKLNRQCAKRFIDINRRARFAIQPDDFTSWDTCVTFYYTFRMEVNHILNDYAFIIKLRQCKYYCW